MNLMKKGMFFGVTLALVSVLFLSNSHASYIPYTVLRGLEGQVRSVAFSPDGKMLASGSLDDTIKLWDTATAEVLKTLTGHEDNSVLSVAFSPDGKMLASGAWTEDVIRLWDVATGEEIATFTGHEHGVNSVAFSPDGKMLASGSLDDTIRLWDVATGEEIATLAGHEHGVNSVAFSPDGKMLASGSGNHSGSFPIRLWDVATGEEIATLTGHEGPVNSVAFNPDGKMLASSSYTIKLWDVATREVLQTLPGSEFGGGVNSVAFSPDGKILASDRQLWDVATGRGRALEYLADRYQQSVFSVAFSPDGRTLAMGSRDGSIELWEIPTTRVRITPSPVEAPAIGEQFEVNVSITDGQNVRGYAVGVEFDARTLRYVSHIRSDYLAGNVFVGPEIFERGFLGFNMVSTDGGKSGNGILATITFEVVARESSTLEVHAVLSDSNGKHLGFFSVDGSVIEPPWDVNGDGVVNILDLSYVAARLGQAGENTADVNRDGIVDIKDLILVASAMDGELPAAPDARLLTTNNLTPAAVTQWLTEAQRLDLTDVRMQRGVAFLEALLTVLIPKETALLANYPNPFNPETWIPYQLSKPTDVTLTIYDIKGSVVRALDLGHQRAGMYQTRSRAAYWDGRNVVGEPVASGLYFYTLTAGDFTATRKMLIRK